MPVSTLTDLERRLVANLSVPRNADDLANELRADPSLPNDLPATDINGLLHDAAGEGWVVKLADTGDPAKVAASLERHKTARAMPDEKARIYTARLQQDVRAWRATGDLWIMTDDGFDKLHEPVEQRAVQATTRQVERMLAAHAACVVQADFAGSINDKNGGELRDDKTVLARGALHDGTLTATMLPEEYQQWAKAVAKAHEEATGEKVRMPVAGGAGGFSDAHETLVVNAANAGTAYSVTAPWYMALTTVAVTDADTGSTITEPTGATGYARKSVAAADMGAATSPGGTSSNANAIVGAGINGGTPQTCVGFARCIAATVGAVQAYGALAANLIISATQTPWQFPAGNHSLVLD